jgi:hypothetical protein
MTLDVMTFLPRFLQHVRPKGFHKIRYTGFLHPSARATLAALQQQLANTTSSATRLPKALAETFGLDVADDSPPNERLPQTPCCCPHCGGPLAFLSRLSPHREIRAPP